MGFSISIKSFTRPIRKTVKKVTKAVTKPIEKAAKKVVQETVDTVAGIDKHERRGEPSPAQKKALEANQKKADAALKKQMKTLEKQEKRLDAQEKRVRYNRVRRSRRGSKATRLLLSPARSNAARGLSKGSGKNLGA